VVIVGRELAEGNVVIKDLQGGTQETIAIDDVVSRFRGEAP
jgi:histidyl-tRNA synthetase